MNVVFLDFDGVITTNNTKYRSFDPICIERLRTILDKTNSKIVISSSWRKFDPIVKLRKMIRMAGIDTEVIGITPSHNSGRGEEIKMFLKLHPEITKFVVLDDNTFDMGPVMDRVVETDSYLGITERNVEQALELMNDL